MPRIAGTSPRLEVGDRQDDDPAGSGSQMGVVIKEHEEPKDPSRSHSWEAFDCFRVRGWTSFFA